MPGHTRVRPSFRGPWAVVAAAVCSLMLLTACTAARGGANDVRLSGEKAPTTTAPVTSTTATTAVPTTTTTAAPPPPPPTTAPPPPPTTSAPVVAPAASDAAALSAHRGLGAWVDVYDWSRYRGTTPSVGPADVDRMADEGVQTLYIQTAKHDTPDEILDRDLLDPILQRARARGLRIVAWYLPTLADPDLDLRRLLASAALGVDALGVDIESREVADVAERNRRLIALSQALRQALPEMSIAAIALPPVVLEVINPAFWPNFPYREIAPSYDLWMVMSYWTNRTHSSGYRDAFRYTEENIRRLRNNVGRADLPVHPIGGIGDETTTADLEGFVRAAAVTQSIGGSIYDYGTTSPEAWGTLRSFRM